MKKLILVFLFFFLWTINLSSHYAKAAVSTSETTEYYGRVNTSNTWFYSSPNSSSGMFLLPQTYFVKISAASGNYYEASYKNVTGYVAKSDVTLMSGNPQNPYFAATFYVYTPYNLYALPSTSSSVVQTFDEGQHFEYYGIKNGEMVTNYSSDWYYASAVVDGKVQYGYVYSCVAKGLTDFAENTDILIEVSPDVLETSTNNTTNFSELSTSTKTLLIISITIPSALILFFLVKPTKGAKRAEKRGIRKIQHGDYFEYDERDI